MSRFETCVNACTNLETLLYCEPLQRLEVLIIFLRFLRFSFFTPCSYVNSGFGA